MEDTTCKAFSSMIFEDHTLGFEESALCVELVSNVARHAKLHVGLTIFMHITRYVRLDAT